MKNITHSVTITLATVITMLLVPSLSTAQNVTIPDPNFKANLLNNNAINTNMDGEIQVSEAQAYTGAITCPYENIASLTGIEAFTSLTELFCYGNLITSLDVSANTALIKLNCKENNPLNYLNVANGNNVNFTFFRASDNPNLTCIQVDDVVYSETNWQSGSSSFEFDPGVTFSTNCGGTSSIEESIDAININIYPNPARTNLNVETNTVTSYFRASVYNLVGEKVIADANETQINIEELPVGTYLLEVTTEHGKSVQKFVKQ